MREAIPIRFAFPIDVPCAFNLVCGRGHSPEEFARKVGAVDLRRCDSIWNLLLRRGTPCGEPPAGEQCAAAGDKRAFDETSAIHLDGRSCRTRSYHHSHARVKGMT